MGPRARLTFYCREILHTSYGIRSLDDPSRMQVAIRTELSRLFEQTEAPRMRFLFSAQIRIYIKICAFSWSDISCVH